MVVLLSAAAMAQSPLALCAEDTHINPTKKQAIDAAARVFVETLLGPTPDAAFDELSQEGQRDLSRAKLGAQAEALIQQFKPTNLTVQHTYFIELTGKSPGRVLCAADLSGPDGWESLAASDMPEQAHVAMSADTRNNQLAFTLWMVPEQNAWKVQSFWMNVQTLADKGPMELFELAQTQNAMDHKFNAALLYAAALQTTNRGPNFQVGLGQSIRQEMSKLALPAEIQGEPPFSWTQDSTTYKVLSVGPVAIGGKIYVTIVNEVGPWQSDQQVDGWNKRLLAYFKQRFPEYSAVFAGVIVRARERGSNRAYGTVEQVSQK